MTTAIAISANEARTITEAIKVATETMWELLNEAHSRKAWKALGYKTWEAYIAAEFDMSRSHAYRILDQGRVVRAIEEAAGGFVPHVGQITHRDVEAIKPVLADVVKEIGCKVKSGADPVEATYTVIEARKVKPEPANTNKPDVSGSADVTDGAEPDHTEADETAIVMRELAEEVETLRAKVVAREEGADVAIDDLREQIRKLEAENETLRISRDGFQTKCSEMLKQCKFWEREARKRGYGK